MFRHKEERRQRLDQLPLSEFRASVNALKQITLYRMEDRMTLFRSKVLTTVYDNIRKSENDLRQYRACRLSNEMKVLLISDPTTDQAAAALSVKYGYKHDFIEGTAHVFQHMLYTSRPNNLFAKYVKKNSGKTDSQTYHEFTTYYFDIKATVFRQALYHFAELFKELPDFSADELKKLITDTICEESERLRQTTKYKLSSLFKWNINPEHDMTKNRCGFMHKAYTRSPEMRPEDVKEVLESLFPIEYGAQVMSLCIVGKESLDDLHRMVLKFFSSVPMRLYHNPPLWYQPKFEFVEKIWCHHIAVDESRLYILYPLNNILGYKQLALDRFFAYLITYRGKKMLASVLEEKGWITWIEAVRYPCGSYYYFMNIGMKLTEEGLKHVDEIVGLFFQFTSMLKERNLRWIFNEFKEIQELKFRYEAKQPIENYVRRIAQKMHESYTNMYIIDILREGFTPLVWSTYWKQVVYEKCGRLYTSPHQMRIFVIDKNTKGYIKEELNCLESECSILYKRETVPKDTLDRWVNARSDELELPANNKFIPTVTSLKLETGRKMSMPYILTDTNVMKSWYKVCHKFNQPIVNMFLHFTCPSITNTVEIHFTLMLVRLIRESLHDDVYAAALVNLKWEIDATAHGILVKITGWDNKQPLLLEKIIDRILFFKLNVETFEAARQYNQQLSIRELEKFEKAQPYEQAHEYLVHLMTDRPTRSEVFQEYSHVTFESFDNFVSKLFSTLHVECFMHGNITVRDVVNISRLVNTKVTQSCAKPLPTRKGRSVLIHERDIKMNNNRHFVFEAYNKHHRSTSTKVFYQLFKNDINDEMRLEEPLKKDLIIQFIREIIEQHYSSLIEEQSLDHYYVHCGVLKTKTVKGLTFLFHSSRRHSHLKITKTIDKFLLFIKDYINKLSEEDFQKKKAEFILYIKNQFKPKTMYEEATAIWNEIITPNYICNRVQREQEYLAEMTLQNVKEFYEQFINKSTPKLTVHVTHEGNKFSCSSESEDNITVIDNMQFFKDLTTSTVQVVNASDTVNAVISKTLDLDSTLTAS